MRRRSILVRLVILALPVALATAGCGAAQATVAPRPSASATAAITPSPAALATVSAAPVPTGSSLPAGSPARLGVQVDPRLLAVLPAQVDGVPLVPDPTTAGKIAADVSLPFFAEAIAVAFAVSSGTSSGDDLAIVTVLRLRPGIFNEPWYWIYRTSYDAAACQAAGGLKGPSTETKIGGRTTHVGTCAGDAHTYHVHLADPTLIVSITAGGPRRFGELVVAGLAE